MNVKYTDFTGVNPADGALVFDEKVKSLLNSKKIDTTIVSPDDLQIFVEGIEHSTDVIHQQLVDDIKSIPNGQAYNLGIVKDIMSMDGRFLEHDDKNVLSKSLSTLNNDVVDTVNGYNINDHFQAVKNDPTKNSVTCSKLIPNCVGTEMVNIFSVDTLPVIRKHNIANKQLGKLLLEVRISNPLMNFKGFITTGVVGNGYGIGFFSEYCKSVDNNTFTIKAFTDSSGLVVDFYIVKTRDGVTTSVYDNMIPTTINISPIISGTVRLNQSILKKVTSTTLSLIGCGDLRNDGHGPIDCIVDSSNKVISYIKSKYYRGNKDLSCQTSVPVKSNNTSKYFNLKVQPLTFGDSTPSTTNGSQNLKSTFGNDHFDMINLLKQIYNFTHLKIYKCFGNIVINNVVVPVIGFNIDNSIGRVSFMISPFFIIPDSMKFIENNPSGKLRNPTVVFDTNANTSHTFTSGGYIGDVSDKNSTNSNIFIMGYDINDGTMIDDKRASYNLSMVDISIEIPDCSGLLNQLQWNTPFRYSGDFNRYTYDFTKNDYDTYPFPGVNRDVSDFNGSTSNIPSLTPESIIMCATDDKAPYVWSDSKPADTFIAYSDTNVQ